MLISELPQGFKAVIIKSIAWSMLVKILQALTGLLISIIIARALGVEGAGNYAAVLAIIQICLIPVQSGLASSMSRNLVKHISRKEYSLSKGLLNFSWLLCFGYTLVVIVAAVLFNYLALDLDWGLLLNILFILLSVSIGRMAAATLNGLQRVVMAQSYDLIRNTCTISVLLGLILFGTNIDLKVSIVVFTMAAFVAAIIMFALLVSKIPSQITNSRSKCLPWPWFRVALIFMMVNGITRINDQSGVVMVKFLSNSFEAGLYNPAYQLSSLLVFGLTAITLTITPFFTKLYGTDDVERLQLLATRSAQASFGFALIAIIVLTLWGKNILINLYGMNYLDSYPALMVLSIGYLAQSSTGSSASLILASGNETSLFKMAFSALIINFAVSAILIFSFGAIGAALSLSISLIAFNLMQYIYCRRWLLIDPLFFRVSLTK